MQYLVGRAGRLVTQEQILQAVWPETFVQPDVLRKYILEIRRVLEDPPRNPRYIETVSRRGYRFIAPVREEAPAAPDPGEIPARLVGRAAALSELDDALGGVLQGRSQVVFVSGEAGIGKTTLVDTFQQRWARDGRIQIARGQCVEGFGGKEAYYPVLEALGRFMRAPSGEFLRQTLAAQAPTWLIQFPSLVRPEQRELLRREILGATGERMVREFCEALESVTAEHPLVLILDDLQWVDDSTLDLISAVARRRGSARFLLLATCRPVEVILSRSPLKQLKQDLLIHGLCREVNLERLHEAHVEQFLEAEFPGGGLARALSTLIHRHSDGNPLFMGALIERLRRRGVIQQQDGRWTLAASLEQLDPGVPETLQEMLEVQLEQLDARQQRLLRAASVSGRRFSAWSVSAMMETDAGQVEELCEDLAARQQFIKRAEIQELPGGSISAQYEFKHVLYREVLYRKLPPTQRRQLHLRVATRMEALSTPPDTALASELASHFEAARDYPRAIRYLIASAGNAARRYAHADALQLLEHARELLAQVSPEAGRGLEIEILEHISDVLYAQGEMVQSAEIDYRAADLAAGSGFKVAQVNALTRVARALAFVDPDRCIAVCERAVEASRAHGDPLLEARAEMLSACWRIVANGWRREDAEICAAARDRIQTLSDELPAYYEILYAHVQCIQGDYEGACETARAGIPKSVENDSLVVYLSAHSSLAHALLHLGRWGEMREVVGRALAIAEKNGNGPWKAIFDAVLAWLHYHAFDLAGAGARCAQLLETHNEEPAGQVRTMAMVIGGFTILDSDEAESLRRFTAVGERQLRPRFFLDWYWRILARLGLSRVYLKRGEVKEARREAALVREAACAGADPVLQGLAWESQAQIEAAAGDRDRAMESLQHALRTLEPFAFPLAAWRVHSTASQLYAAAGEAALAEDHRERAAAVLRRLADSLTANDPLRESTLRAPAIRPLADRASS